MITILTIISMLVIAAYTAAVCVKTKGVPYSISATYYYLEHKLWFMATMWLTAGLLMPAILEVSKPNTEWIAFLSYNNDMELAKERLKPDGYDGLVMKMLESNEAVAAGGNRTVSNLELASFNRMHEGFNRDLKTIQAGFYSKEEKCFKGGMNNEPVEITLETLTGSAFDKLLDTNKDVPAGALAVLYDKMVK